MLSHHRTKSPPKQWLAAIHRSEAKRRHSAMTCRSHICWDHPGFHIYSWLPKALLKHVCYNLENVTSLYNLYSYRRHLMSKQSKPTNCDDFADVWISVCALTVAFKWKSHHRIPSMYHWQCIWEVSRRRASLLRAVHVSISWSNVDWTKMSKCSVSHSDSGFADSTEYSVSSSWKRQCRCN